MFSQSKVIHWNYHATCVLVAGGPGHRLRSVQTVITAHTRLSLQEGEPISFIDTWNKSHSIKFSTKSKYLLDFFWKLKIKH